MNNYATPKQRWYFAHLLVGTGREDELGIELSGNKEMRIAEALMMTDSLIIGDAIQKIKSGDIHGAIHEIKLK